MSLQWDMLTWKEKKALRLALKENNGRMGVTFLRDNVYRNDDRARDAIEKMNKNGFLEKSDIGNKYDILKDKIPNKELEKAK